MKTKDVVQFNENHKWCGCLGIITEVRKLRRDIRYTVGIPVPHGDETCTAYIYVNKSEGALERIGVAAMVERSEQDDRG